MVVSKQLKKQIILEILALLFLVGVIVYAVFAIQKSKANKVQSLQGMVIVIDDSNMKELAKYSDGQGMLTDGTKYTLTNNNKEDVEYEVVLIPDVVDEDILSNIRISTDDLYVSTLTDLPRDNGGYVLTTNTLKPGYTKIHLIKAWYKLSTDDELVKGDIKFEYKLVKK